SGPPAPSGMTFEVANDQPASTTGPRIQLSAPTVVEYSAEETLAAAACPTSSLRPCRDSRPLFARCDRRLSTKPGAWPEGRRRRRGFRAGRPGSTYRPFLRFTSDVVAVLEVQGWPRSPNTSRPPTLRSAPTSRP